MGVLYVGRVQSKHKTIEIRWDESAEEVVNDINYYLKTYPKVELNFYIRHEATCETVQQHFMEKGLMKVNEKNEVTSLLTIKPSGDGTGNKTIRQNQSKSANSPQY